MTKQSDGYQIIRNESERDVVLPRRGTKLSHCLGDVISRYPQEVTTQQVTTTMRMESSEVAGLMMVLSHKGLIEVTKEGRGQAGGSTWRLTKRAVKMLKL